MLRLLTQRTIQMDTRHKVKAGCLVLIIRLFKSTIHVCQSILLWCSKSNYVRDVYCDPRWKRSGLMVSALDCGSNGPGSRSGDIELCSWVVCRHYLTLL